jgi:SAM-dependent methyltransferase
VQIDRARRLVPEATFLTADMCGADLAFDESSFDAVVSFFAIFHVPLSEQRSLFERIARWLRPGGLLLVTVGHRAWTGTEEDWLGGGATMYWSHGDIEMYLRWLSEMGFSVETSLFVPEGEGGHVLVLARST